MIAWHSFRLQTHSLDNGSVTDPLRLTAIPPCNSWPKGRCDSAIFVHNSANFPCLPGVGLSGEFSNRPIHRNSHPYLGFTVAQVQLILHPIWDAAVNIPLYLVHAQWFDIVPQLSASSPSRAATPDPATGLYILKCAVRSDNTHIGDIIPLSHCHLPVQLIPRFGEKAHPMLMCKTSMERSREFFLNGYFDKDIHLEKPCRPGEPTRYYAKV
jgi:hypothetical protein